MVTLPGQLTYRAYQPGDETQILSLFKLVFRREMSEQFWKWRYLDNPFGQALSMLALDGEKLVGHFAVLPMAVQFGGRIFRAIFPVTAMTHPDYAGQGIFTRLITTTYEFCRRAGFTLVYGFFNRTLCRGFSCLACPCPSHPFNGDRPAYFLCGKSLPTVDSKGDKG